jgi:hypothetical protein
MSEGEQRTNYGSLVHSDVRGGGAYSSVRDPAAAEAAGDYKQASAPLKVPWIPPIWPTFDVRVL